MFNEDDIKNFEKRKEKPINKELNNKEKSNESKIKDEKSKDKENNNIETPTETNKSSNTTIEEETIIHIIESGTDNGYRKNEEENWMTECFSKFYF